MTWLTHEVGAAQMRAAARRGLPPDPSHRSDDPCPWGLCPEDEWTRTTGYSGGASTAPDRARMTIQTTNTDRLRAIGVVTDGTHGPFIDPDKVLALAARVAAPSDGLTMRGHVPGACWCGDEHEDEPSDGTVARVAAPSDGLPSYHYSAVTDPQTGKLRPMMPVEMRAGFAAPADGLREGPADPGGLRAFWNGDEPRRIIVQLPPIGPDGRCTRCGSTPSRDTGSCRCHRVVIEQVGAIDDPVASLPYTLDAARVAAPSDGLVADRLARAFHEAKKVGGPWGPCAYRDATGDMVPVAFDDNSEDDFACLCRAMANHVVAEYAALAATPTDD
jgi:hypothetical protein